MIRRAIIPGGLPLAVALPSISGTPGVGSTLLAAVGGWTHNPYLFQYQWNRAGAAISGATASTYVPVAADVGNQLTVTVTVTNFTGSANATSPPTAAVSSDVLRIALVIAVGAVPIVA